MMVQNPTIFSLVKGAEEGQTKLNSFDNALLKAGVGDTNLVRMSSIIPPNCELVDSIVLPKGALIPIAYAAITSENPGEIISAAIGVGLPENEGEPGLIMEFEDTKPLAEVEAIVRQMVVDGYAYRNRKYKEIITIGVEHKVEKIASVFAAAVLWYK